MRRLSAFLLVSVLGCAGVTRRGGPLAAALTDARIAVVADPDDVRARARLVDLELEAGNRGAALEQLLAIDRIGGPLRTRLADSHRRLLGELLRERAQDRAVRGSAAALGDLQRAAALGADIPPEDLVSAAQMVALLALRHADDRRRADGRAQLARLAAAADAPPDLVRLSAGLEPAADELQRQDAAGTLWYLGARRAAVDTLTVGGQRIANVTHASWRDELEAWWTGVRAPLIADGGAACVEATLLALIGETHQLDGWSAAVRGCLATTRSLDVDVDAAAPTLRPALLRALGRSTEVAAAVQTALATPPPPGQPGLALVAAAEAALDGRPSTATRALLGGAQDVPAAQLARIVVPEPEVIDDLDLDRLIADRAARRGERTAFEDALYAVVQAFRRDPALGYAAAEALLAREVDRAAINAGLGALYDQLGDPARARVAWQQAVDEDPAPGYLLGLAQAAASERDPDAALVHLTAAAAASGDPAVPMILVARSLLAAGAATHAIEVLRGAIELAGADDLAPAVRLAAEASRAAGRDAQADALLASYGLAPAPMDDDPTDAEAALRSGDPVRLSVASRWHRRNHHGVALRAQLLDRTRTDDPRHRLALVELARCVEGESVLVADAAERALRRYVTQRR